MLNFHPINFTINKIDNTQANKSFYNTQKMPCDTFVRTGSKVSFCGNQKESDFAKFLKEYNLQEKLPEILNSKNAIGHGYNHTVYSIPNNEEYVLRTPSSFDLSKIKNAEIKIEATEDDLDINIGQKVGQIEVKNGLSSTIEVLKKQKGEPIGNPPPTAVFDEYTGKLRNGELEYESPIRKEKFAKSIEALANLPVKSYEKLIEDYRIAANNGYFFDHLNSNNLLVDSENQTIGFIDMDKRKDEPNFGNLLSALTNSCYLNTYISTDYRNQVSEDDKNTVIKNTITIINKYLEAMKNKHETINFDKSSMEFFTFMNSAPMSFACGAWDFEEKKKFINDKLNQAQ